MVLQIYRSTMRTETDRRGFGGKVRSFGSAYPVRLPLRVLRSSTLRAACVRTGYARERSSSFFPPSHSRRARVLEQAFRVQRCVLHEMVELEACSRYQGNLNTDCHGLLLGFLPNSFLPSTLSCTENPSRGNVSSWYCRSIDLQ